jgi:hypothetical protein
MAKQLFLALIVSAVLLLVTAFLLAAIESLEPLQ